MHSIVEVPALNVFCSSGETQTSNREQPACLIEAKPDTLEIDDKLWQAYQWKDEITLRCALLDARGSIKKVRYDGAGGKVYTLRVADLAYRNKH